jgi:hypothetical protein
MWSTDEWNVKKSGLLAFYFAVEIFLFYAALQYFKTSSEIFGKLAFFIGFGFIAILGIGIDAFLKMKGKDEDTELVDTITIEEPEDAPIHVSFKWQLLISLGLGILIAIWISTTGNALVQAPQFQVFDGKTGNAFLGAITGGVIETAVFFGLITPSLVVIVQRFTGNQILGVLAGIIGGALIFMLYHTVAYQYDQMALVSVFIFGIINTILLFTFRSVVPLIILHTINNLMVGMMLITTFGIIL